MPLNWIDWIILAMVVISTILGLIKGFVRQAIAIAALIVGFILASHYYLRLAISLQPAMANDSWAKLVAFLLIFFAFVVFGWVLGIIISKLMKGPFKLADIIFGGIFGFLKGGLIAAVFVIALLLFPVKEKDLVESQLAFPSLRIGQGLIQLVPWELKTRFKEAYQKLKEELNPAKKKV